MVAPKYSIKEGGSPIYGYIPQMCLFELIERTMAFKVTKASVSEQPEAHNLIKEIEAKHLRPLSRCKDFIADR